MLKGGVIGVQFNDRRDKAFGTPDGLSERTQLENDVVNFLLFLTEYVAGLYATTRFIS